ncbi:ZAR1-like protein [Malaclemys terrapin pileata]|uniref:ZAR1-like protein n=1 Tax=Malaclemys terrapin pileata TaxID=2991368 RepID=UPI0023A80DEF|nr:ZAR1-like protein [Malaclemys terrapin pileata]
MERFIYPLYSVYQGYGGIFTSSQGEGFVGPKKKQPKWKQSKGSSSPSPGVPTTPSTAAAPEPADYLDSYMGAQLKVLLSQVSLGLTPWLHKANTKEVGVQVNPRVDASVQCLMGNVFSPKTCSKTRCSCPQKKRHIDLKRTHRQELCGRCKGKRLFCDNTYSFKYIV